MKIFSWTKLFGDIWGMARRDKKMSLLVLIWLLVILGMVTVFAALLGPLQPFVYTLL